MRIIIPKQMNWNLPEGRFNARLTEISSKFDRGEEYARFTFEVDVPSLDKFQNLAAKNYKVDMRFGGQLRNVLEDMQGAEWINNRSGEELDLKTLIGQNVVLDLRHYHKHSHAHPFVDIIKVHPLQNN